MKDPDVQLVNFLHGIIREEVELHKPEVHKKSLRKVKSLMQNGRDEFGGKTGSCTTPDWGCPALRCAYVYHTTPCTVSACTSHLSRLIENNNFLLRRILLTGSCTVCCISTGMAAELVSLVEALREALRGRSKIDVEVVVISSGPDWTRMTGKMVDKLSEVADLAGLKLKPRFLSADLTRHLTDDVKAAIGRSDLVTMVHYMSGIRGEGNGPDTLQNIVSLLRGGSTLFFLDFPEFQLRGAMVEDKTGTFENVVDVYGPLDYNVHRMSLLCRKQCLRLYCKHYGWRYCELESSSYVCAWYKRSSSHQKLLQQ